MRLDTETNHTNGHLPTLSEQHSRHCCSISYTQHSNSFKPQHCSKLNTLQQHNNANHETNGGSDANFNSDEDECKQQINSVMTPSNPSSVAAPLLSFYSHMQPSTVQPQPHFITAQQLPLTHRHLLAHYNNMTPTLARYYHVNHVNLRVVHKRFDEKLQLLHRWVLLEVKETMKDKLRRVIEFGCITIHLSSLPSALHSAIHAGTIPFGSLLMSAAIHQQCRPAAFFSLQLDEQLKLMLEVEDEVVERGIVYGRCNTIRCADSGKVIADVVEVLPN